MNNTAETLRAGLFKALAHPTRLRILEILKDGELCVCKIYEALDLEQSNVSQHLKVLRDKDIVRTRRDGSMILYRITRPEIQALLDLSGTFLSGILADTLSELKGD